MRIGLDFRFLSYGRVALNRGVGRYSQQQLREVLRIDRQNEYILVCRPDADRASLHPAIGAAPNVRIITIPETICQPNPEAYLGENYLHTGSQFQKWLHRLDLGLYHVTVPFLFQEPMVVAHDCCPAVFTHYDLIPLVYPKHYFPGVRHGTARQYFVRTCRALRHADRVLAISDFVGAEAAAYLGIERARISVATPFADPCFRPLPREQVEVRLAAIASRTGMRLPDGFVLAVSHLHHSKNLHTLLQGFAMLPAAWRTRHPLVLAFDTSPGEQAVVRAWFREFGIADTALATGFVSDDEMAALYNAAYLFVHPSRHEGFGLPVLEAMQCGAAVVASDAAALPEVAGEAAVLVDPDDPAAFARAMEELGGDEGRRRSLKETGIRRAQHFSARALGEATLACYQAAVGASKAYVGHTRPRLAMWTPLPPQESGVADYGAELIPLLARWAEIEVFVDGGFEPSPSIADDFRVFHYSAFERRHTLRPFDLVIYQMGASHFHVFMDEAIRKWPGLVVLHDLTWSHALYHLAGRGTLPSDFKTALARLEGPEAVREFRHIQHQEKGAHALEAFLTDHPMLRDVAQASRAIVVHYPDAKRELESRYPGSRVFCFPMGVRDPIPTVGAQAVNAIRVRYGLDRDAFVVGIFGIADPVKRIEATLEAVARVRSAPALKHLPDIQVVIVGSFTSSAYEAEIRRRALELGLEGRVRLLGRVPERVWQELLVACDAVVNLRFPFRKQMSATLMRAVAAGKPVAVTKLEAWAHLPDTFSREVPTGDCEVQTLAGFLGDLAADPALKATMSHAAREYYVAQATMWRLSENYRIVAEAILGTRAKEKNAMPLPPDHATALPYTKACTIEDFRDPDLAALIGEVFAHEASSGGPEYPVGHEDRRQWEVAMSLRAFRDHGVLRPDATVLAVGAGTERTLFYLTGKVGNVIAADLYLDPGSRSNGAPSAMLVEPERFSPYPFDRSRLDVRHMDGRVLDLPDNSVDGILSSSVVEHFADWAAVAASAYEMGRVLKPNGILCLSTEFLIAGPPNTAGWEGVLLFNKETLRRFVVEASGLEPIGPLDLAVSDRTLATRRDLAKSLDEVRGGLRQLPDLVFIQNGQVFGSVHLTLRKSAGYPTCDNAWARPTDSLRSAVKNAEADLADRLTRVLNPALAGRGKEGGEALARSLTAATLSERQQILEAAFARWDSIRERSARDAPEPRPAVRRAMGFLKRTIKRIRDLGVARDHDREMLRGLLDALSDLEQRLAALESEGERSRRNLR